MRKIKTTTKTITTVYGALLITAYLLFVGPGGYARILPNKYTAFLILSGCFPLFTTAFYKKGARQRPWATPARISLLLFAGCSVCSTIVSPFWREAILGGARKEGLVSILLYVMIFMIFSTYGFSLKLFAYLSGGAMTICNLIALLQFDGRNPLSLYPEGMNYFGAGTDYMWEYLGTIGNVDLVSAVMCLCIPLYLCYIILQKEDPWRFFLLVPLFLCIVVTVKMWVLAALCGLIIGLVFSIPVLLDKNKTAQRRSIVVILIFIVCAVFFLRFIDVGSGMFHELHEILNGRVSVNFGSQRIVIWQQVWEVIQQRPIFGSGPDTLALWGKGFCGYSGFYQAQVTTIIDTAHNEFLNIWANQGVLALFAYLAALIYLAWRWIKNGVQDTTVTICGCSLLCYCVQAFFGMSSCITAPYFWMMMGMLQYADSKRLAGRET